jgi:hypothetical protein
MEKIEVSERCQSCGGTGLYSGMAERDGAAIQCYTCKGTGCHQFVHTYEPFTHREKSEGVIRVYEGNPGIVIGAGGGYAGGSYSLEDFGGIPLEDWEAGKPFPPGSENRQFTCPAWWYQSVDYDKKPDWTGCKSFNGSFTSCRHFASKAACWERWDREYGAGEAGSKEA